MTNPYRLLGPGGGLLLQQLLTDLRAARRSPGLRPRGPDPRRRSPRTWSRATAAGALVVVAVTGAVQLPAAEADARPRKTPVVTPTPTPTLTATPTASATPTVSVTPTTTATAAVCAQTASINGATWCTVSVSDVVYGTHPIGTPVVLRALTVDELWDRAVWLYVVPYCAGYCAAYVDAGVVRFPDDPVPAMGQVIDVWGWMSPGGMTAAGFQLVG